MSVFVDDMYLSDMGKYGRMKMSHMVADSQEELLAMATAIKMAHRWIQHKGEPGEHFDICMSMRVLAVQHGAIPITLRQCSAMNLRRRVTGVLGQPDEALQWIENHFKAKRSTIET